MRSLKNLVPLLCMAISLSSFAGSAGFVDLTQQQWQPEHSYFGRTPAGFCNISFSKNTIAFSDSRHTVLAYSPVHSTSEFMVLEVEAHQSDKTECIHPKASGKTYWRIDKRSYWLCEAWKPEAKNCPTEFGSWDSRVFELSIFGTLDDAMNYKTAPLDVHGYYPVKKGE